MLRLAGDFGAISSFRCRDVAPTAESEMSDDAVARNVCVWMGFEVTAYTGRDAK